MFCNQPSGNILAANGGNIDKRATGHACPSLTADFHACKNYRFLKYSESDVGVDAGLVIFVGGLVLGAPLILVFRHLYLWVKKGFKMADFDPKN